MRIGNFAILEEESMAWLENLAAESIEETETTSPEAPVEELPDWMQAEESPLEQPTEAAPEDEDAMAWLTSQGIEAQRLA